MSGSEFFCPKTLADALALLDQYQQTAVVVNGGTDIVEKIANGTVKPTAVIYIQDIAELQGIRENNGLVCIGGAATYQQVLESPLCQQFTALLEAVVEIGSPPIRVVGTPAGNLGTAVPAADCNVALVALNAQIVLASSHGERVVEAKDMFIGYCRTERLPEELIREIRIPSLTGGMGSAFVKIAKRKAQDISQVAAGVSLTVAGEVCQDISIALGAVNSTTVKAYSLEKMMRGQTLASGLAALKGAFPVEASLRSPRNKAYKEAVIHVVVARAINKAFAEALKGGK